MTTQMMGTDRLIVSTSTSCRVYNFQLIFNNENQAFSQDIFT